MQCTGPWTGPWIAMDIAMDEVRQRVQAAFEAVRRRDFLREDQRANAELDQALPIGFRQTNSQPRTVANMLTLLDAREGDRVLDVGSGSGWTTALLGVLVGPTGRVFGVELVPELVDWSRENMSSHPMPWTSIHQARQGQLGLPDEAPFDRILVSAEADELPQALVDQLVVGGTMVVPVGGRLLLVERRSRDDVAVHPHGHYAFVPLR
jgi:protein-L-isoaspartate(D-aspartate) O-methyltransferase